ncbi:MAG: hypothetical protein ACI808_000083 [Paraglaciecola sp.]|jgi:hypothetical protein
MNKVLLLMVVSFCCIACSDKGVFHTWQTSSSMLIKYAEQEKNKLPIGENTEAEKKYLLLYDIYIKANSYAVLNKIFFILSIISALAVFLWPSISVMFKSNLEKREWLRSATVQTTVTAIAALMFTFYSQYKEKQTYAENLMRYVVYSEHTSSDLALKISEELAKIDNGFSFHSVMSKGDNGS